MDGKVRFGRFGWKYLYGADFSVISIRSSVKKGVGRWMVPAGWQIHLGIEILSLKRKIGIRQ
jgi:hypothetical protein